MSLEPIRSSLSDALRRARIAPQVKAATTVEAAQRVFDERLPARYRVRVVSYADRCLTVEARQDAVALWIEEHEEELKRDMEVLTSGGQIARIQIRRFSRPSVIY